MDDSKKALNLFGSSDIDKIQAEIERDLNKANFLNNDIPEDNYTLLDKDYSMLDIPADIPPDILIEDSFADAYTDDWIPPLADGETIPATDGFYRETIKNPEQRTAPLSGWFRKAVALFIVFTLGTGSLGLGIGAGIGWLRQTEGQQAATYHTGDRTLTTVSPTFSEAADGNIMGENTVGTLADVVEMLAPSVVAITSYSAASPHSSFFGSGLIFAENDERIFIVTNNYVVQRRDRVTVSIDGSVPIDARPAGEDTTVDLSVISIYKSQLVDAGIDSIVIATFGDSDQMRVGDTVLAIGNAMGEGNSVTRGVISASEKSVALPVTGHVLTLLQTDAAINHGNSGGPLINTRGEVIGININRASSIVFGMAPVEGIGYSISSNIVAPRLEDIIMGRRPALGITGSNVPNEMAAELNIPPIGVYVSTVVEGRAAYRGGIQAEDIITGFNGMPVLNWTQLVYAIRSARIGDVVEVRVLRYGNTAITLYVELDVMIVDNF